MATPKHTQPDQVAPVASRVASREHTRTSDPACHAHHLVLPLADQPTGTQRERVERLLYRVPEAAEAPDIAMATMNRAPTEAERAYVRARARRAALTLFEIDQERERAATRHDEAA
jgi:hypothetical protein